VRRLLWQQNLGYPYRCATKNLPAFRNYFLTTILPITVLGPRVDDPLRSIAAAGKQTKPKR
jgi:hypothetical protein